MKMSAFFYLDQFFFSGIGEQNCNYWHLMNEIRPFHFNQSFEMQQGEEVSILKNVFCSQVAHAHKRWAHSPDFPKVHQ